MACEEGPRRECSEFEVSWPPTDEMEVGNHPEAEDDDQARSGSHVGKVV